MKGERNLVVLKHGYATMIPVVTMMAYSLARFQWWFHRGVEKANRPGLDAYLRDS